MKLYTSDLYILLSLSGMVFFWSWAPTLMLIVPLATIVLLTEEYLGRCPCCSSAPTDRSGYPRAIVINLIFLMVCVAVLLATFET